VKKIKPQKTLLALFFAALFAPTAYSAQQPAGNNNEPSDVKDEVEVIEVKGYAGSLDRALVEKRHADSIVDGISADDMGALPTQNVAEALQRIPGLSISRERGEGLFVTIRGLGPEFNSTTVNGRSVAVNENVADGNQTGRQFRFDVLSSDLVSSISVAKTPTADKDGGSIGGTIDIRTARPLDYEGNVFNFSGSAAYAELAEEWDPKLSALGSWQNDEGTFGVLASIAQSTRTLRQDSFYTFDWKKIPGDPAGLDLDGDGTMDVDPNEDAYRPGTTRQGLFIDKRERLGASVTLQWMPTDDFSATFDVLYSKFDVETEQYALAHRLGNGALQPGSITVDSHNSVVAGTTRQQVRTDHEFEPITNDNIVVGLNLEWFVGDWKIAGDITASKATSEFSDMPVRVLGRYTSDISWDYRNATIGDLIPAISSSDPASYSGFTIQSFVRSSDDEDASIQLDLERDIDSDFFTKVMFGGKYRTRQRDFARFSRNFNKGSHYPAGEGFPGSAMTDDLLDALPVDNLLSGFSGDFNRQWPVYNHAAVLSAFEPLEGYQFPYPPNDGDLLSTYLIEEDITSAYVRLDFDSEWFGKSVHGNFGLRYEETEQVSSGYANAGTGPEAVSFDNTYDNLLPSLNIAVDLNEDLVLRFAASQVMTRPSLVSIAPQLTLNPASQTGRGGNPDLDPFEADQFDVSLEWYFNRAGALTFAAFYKDIGSFITAETIQVDFEGLTYNVSSRINGGEAEITGLEIGYSQVFDMLPAPFDGLGLQANYTNIDSNADFSSENSTVSNSVEGLSKHNANLVAFWEKEAWSVRAGYNYRSEYLDTISDTLGNPRSTKAFGTLDMQVSYEWNESLSFFAEGLNLNGAHVEKYIVEESRLREIQEFGSRYIVGFRFNM